MHIVVETSLNDGVAEYSNMGDTSMLQVAVIRLKEQWPLASIEVITGSAENLAKYCPGTKPLNRVGRDLWIGEDFLFSLFGRFHSSLPGWISLWLRGFTRLLERRRPALLKFMIRLRLRLRDDVKVRHLMLFLEAMENADLLVISGSGGFADNTRDWNIRILGLLEVAIRRNVPIAMFGQGIGPLDDPEVLSRAKTVFPSVRFISLRGGRGGLNLLESLGVSSSRVVTTGDEAIELAYYARSQELGQALGVNLRVASYAEVGGNVIEKLRPVLQEFARLHNAPIIPVPIAFHSWANDHLTIQELLSGFDDKSDGGSSLDTPLKVIQQAGRCKVVLTGAYHAAVFALAQGIPVVCLAVSPYYVAKFLGLEDQFGLGCETILLGDVDAYEKIPLAIERAWQSAENVRIPLQQAAISQIELSRNAYERVKVLLNADRSEDYVY